MSADELNQGIRLFNEAKFFEAHEALEDVWREAPAHEKKFLQGLVQVAVAFHHHSTGNLVGMTSVLKRAMGNLEECPASFHGIDIRQLLARLSLWRDAMDRNESFPPLPQFRTLEVGRK